MFPPPHFLLSHSFPFLLPPPISLQGLVRFRGQLGRTWSWPLWAFAKTRRALEREYSHLRTYPAIRSDSQAQSQKKKGGVVSLWSFFSSLAWGRDGWREFRSSLSLSLTTSYLTVPYLVA